MNTTWIWIGVAIYIVIATLVAFWSKTGKSETMGDYFLGDRQMPGIVSALSYSATTYSAFMLIGLAGLTYTGGVGALGFELLYLCGVTLVLIFGPRFWLVGKKFGYVTPTEMLGHRYDSKALAAIAALASCVFLIPYCAVQLAGVGYLLSGMTEGSINFTTGTIIATILAIVFSMVAGLRSVVWTDALQAVIMIISATIVVILVVVALGGTEFFNRLTETSPGALSVPGPGKGFFSFSTFLALTVPWVFFSLSNPQVSQRLYTPKTMRDLRKMLLGFLVFGFIYTLVAVMWGFAARAKFPDLESADLATPSLLGSDIVPAALALIVMIGILAAAVSTIDSILLTLSSMVSRDVYRHSSATSDELKQLAVGKFVIPVIAVLAFLFALLKFNLIAVLSVSASAGLLVTVPPLIGAFFWKRGTAPAAIWSIVIAGLMVLGLEATKTKFLGQGSGVWGIIVATGLFIGISLATQPPTERASEFMDHVRTKLKEHKAV